MAGTRDGRRARGRAARRGRAPAGARAARGPALSAAASPRLQRNRASLNLPGKCDGRRNIGKPTVSGGDRTMRKQIVRLTAALLAVGCIAPAMAQDKPARIVLEAATGSVMVSDGGDYASVEVGKELAQGES